MKPSIIFVDYLHKIGPDIALGDKAVEQAKKVFEEMKEMAKQNNCAVVLKVQPNLKNLGEARKEAEAKKRLEAENKAFDHFITTGEVAPIPNSAIIKKDEP